MNEVRLPGGFVNAVVRRGDAVLRRPGERAEFVHDLLLCLDAWEGAPRLLGVDEDGRERLSFIDGYVAWERPWRDAVTSAEALKSVGRYADLGHLHRVVPQWKALLDGYGPTDTSALISTILWWQTRTADGIDAEAGAGDPAMQHLQHLGVPTDIRKRRDWVSANSAALAAEVGEGPVG